MKHLNTVALATTIVFGGLAAAQDQGPKADKPWQHDDGTVVYQGKKFPSWKAFHASPLFDPQNRCLAPVPGPDEGDPDFGNLRGIDPGDCAYTSTTIGPEYDPGIDTYRISVVVHVIQNDAGTLGYIAPDKVESGIRILNEDFNALIGTPGEPGTFANLEFVLADEDPDGNPTTGITYSQNTTWYNDGGSYWNTLAWDPTRYLNIYTTTASGALGYVSGFPSEPGFPGSLEDRVVVLWECYGDDAPYGPPFNLGRTLTHEVGHYLGLFHTFQGGCGSGGCYTSGDLICDTNFESGPNFGCGTGSTCGSPDPTDNYMDYSDDACMNKFTTEQVNRMRCSLLNYRPLIYEEGGSCSNGDPGFGAPAVQPDTTVSVVLEDCDLDLDPAGAESAEVRVYSDFDSGGFLVTLTEDAVDSGAFSASIEITSTPGFKGLALYAPEGTNIYVDYLDAVDADGNTDVLITGSAVVDGTIETPTIEVADFGASTATVFVSGTEDLIATVRYGTSCGSLTETAGPSASGIDNEIGLAGLVDGVVYSYVVDLEDAAGNQATVPAVGCFDFEFDALPFFAEQFTGGFDLANTSVRFVAVGGTDVYAGCAEPISNLPVDPAGGIGLSLGDDDASSVAIPFSFDFYGQSYSSVSVGSNGYLVFGGSDTTYEESLDNHFSVVRISALFDDLDPTAGGSISYRGQGDSLAITWQDVPEYSTSNSNTFQVVLSSNGDVTIAWLDIASTDSVVGLSDGNGLDSTFEPADLSTAAAGCLPRPPSVSDVAVGTLPGTPVDISLNASDDGTPGPLSIIIRSLPTSGVLRDLGSNTVISTVPHVVSDNTAPQVRFEPPAGLEFTTTFLYGADDGGVPPEGGASPDGTVTVVVVSGPRPIVTWDMDEDPAWTLEGAWSWGSPTGGGGDPAGGATGSNVVGFALNAEYPNNLPETHATTPPVDCSRATETTLRFKRWLGVERSLYDHAYIRLSNDGGGTWTTIYENPDSSFEDTSWQDAEFDISDLADGRSDVRIRFTMGTTDGSVTYCGWNVDDVVIEGVVPDDEPSADLDGNGVVDGSDVGLLLASWGPCTGCPADLNGDGLVDGSDFGLLLVAWGTAG
ncbi:MAG: M43 family zinc metalloprotease [Planctomycetota bacterium]|nr:M43 family zinc metalloprotease [Planctomycetota bacterium]